MACALVNNFSLVICYFINIFFVYQLITIATRHCVAATYYAALFYIVFSFQSYSCPPPLLTLRSSPSCPPPRRSRYFHFLWTRRLLKIKKIKKSFFIIIIFMLSSNKYLYLNTSIHHCLQLLYLTLTLHGYCLLLVCSLITG